MPPLVISDDEVQQLQALASSRSLPHSIVQRAQIVLACGAGETNTAIAKRMGLTGMIVGKWRKRYRELGLRWSGFSGQPPSLTSEAGHRP
jgi:putative transposase